MSRTCPACGEEIKKAEARFCPNCGQPFGEGLDTDQPTLLIRIPFQAPQKVVLNRASFTIGRQPDNDIVLPTGYVSGHHGRLEQREGTWNYTDLDSTNGTFVNGERVTQVELKNGDIIRIGDLEGNSVGLTFRAASAEEAGGTTAPTPSAIRMGSTTLGIKRAMLIGRDPQADIHVPSPTVSWHHARLEQTKEGHRLTDLSSTCWKRATWSRWARTGWSTPRAVCSSTRSVGACGWTGSAWRGRSAGARGNGRF